MTDSTDGRDPDTHALLDHTRHNVVSLLAQVPRPCRLRVQAGDVVIEAEWDHAVPAGTTPLPALGNGSPFRPSSVDLGHDFLTASAVGVFYRASQPGAAPFVSEGDAVRPGQQVAIIEAMKLMIPVEADRAGRVVEVLKADGEPVEYGDRLFALSTEAG
jgi:acetyl-CoA carboxylase biotin carboxyl carrier protein